ncbi:hypothetical protein BGZ63DRAFT_409738 [Mariannaea sp. PMI_226]|nr:hypothetical protein BGZ63DRAFT_409738 [Mariannaea sp. PMI_226]
MVCLPHSRAGGGNLQRGKSVSRSWSPTITSLTLSNQETRRTDGIFKRLFRTEWPIDTTPSTTLKAVWSMLIAQYTASNGVIFGLTIMGMPAPFTGINLIAGPIIPTVPLRAKVEWTDTPRAPLQATQTQATQMILYEHYGLRSLSSLSPEAKWACQFQLTLAIQSPESPQEHDQLFRLGRSDSDIQRFNEYALIVECTLDDRLPGVGVNFRFDRHFIDDVQVERILAQFEHLLPPERDKQTEREIISERIKEQPSAIAVHSGDGSLVYGNLHNMAQQLAYSLVVQHGVRSETLVPVCFDKSLWTPVAILAIILAAGVVVAMDPASRLSGCNRLRISIGNHTHKSSKNLRPLSSLMMKNQFRIFLESLPVSRLRSSRGKTQSTSGTTDDDLRNDLTTSIQRLNFNHLVTTPSLIRTTEPTTVLILKLIGVGGVSLAIDDLTRWENRPGVTVLNLNGPSEPTVISKVAVYGEGFKTQLSLGRYYGLNAWVVNYSGRADDPRAGRGHWRVGP